MVYVLKELVEKAKQGDSAAAEEIIVRLRPLIYSVISQRGSGSDRDDLYQQACLIVLECIKDFNPSRGVPFLIYVKKKVYFGLLNVSRHKSDTISLDQEIKGYDSEGCTLSHLLESKDPGVEEVVMQNYDARQLYHAIGRLSPKQRQVILLHFFKGLKFKDIARVRKSHYKSVLRLKDRALKFLREEMEKY